MPYVSHATRCNRKTSIIIYVVSLLGVSKAAMQFSPAATWMSKCAAEQQVATSQCQLTIAMRVIHSIIAEGKINEVLDEQLQNACDNQENPLHKCAVDLLWSFVGSTSAHQQGCSAVANTYGNAVAAGVANTLCMRSSGQSSTCLVAVTNALATANASVPRWLAADSTLPDSADTQALCHALQSTGCCAQSVLQNFAAVAHFDCTSNLPDYLMQLPSRCMEAGIELLSGCPMDDHTIINPEVLHDAHVACDGNGTNSILQEFDCTKYNAHVLECPSSSCGAFCGIQSLMYDIPEQEGNATASATSNHALQLAFLVGLAAFAGVVLLGFLLWCCTLQCARCWTVWRSRTGRVGKKDLARAGANMPYMPLDLDSPTAAKAEKAAEPEEMWGPSASGAGIIKSVTMPKHYHHDLALVASTGSFMAHLDAPSAIHVAEGLNADQDLMQAPAIPLPMSVGSQQAATVQPSSRYQSVEMFSRGVDGDRGC